HKAGHDRPPQLMFRSLNPGGLKHRETAVQSPCQPVQAWRTGQELSDRFREFLLTNAVDDCRMPESARRENNRCMAADPAGLKDNQRLPEIVLPSRKFLSDAPASTGFSGWDTWGAPTVLLFQKCVSARGPLPSISPGLRRGYRYSEWQAPAVPDSDLPAQRSRHGN